MEERYEGIRSLNPAECARLMRDRIQTPDFASLSEKSVRRLSS